jgi:pyruvate/2-oxoglutarate dehydrogenase complex dihydrolipoamide acyltransferase (E2) component
MSLIKEIAVPLIAVNDTSLTVVELSFANGAQIKKGDTVMVFETSKTTYNVEADADGYIQYLCETGSDYEVGYIAAKIFSTAEEIVIEPQTIPGKSNKTVRPAIELTTPVWEGETLFSHKAAELMKERNISPAQFSGRDFVSEDDVKLLLGISVKPSVQHTPKVQQAAAVVKTVPPQLLEKVIVEKLSSNKKREIQFLSEVQSSGLTSTIHTQVEAEGFFLHVNQSLQTLKNSLLPVIIYECARLLKKYPLLNSFFNGDTIAIYNDVHIGFAIDIDKGLKVVRIQDTDKKSIQQTEEAILELSGRYLDDKLSIEDLTDVTFTITDLSAESTASLSLL